MSIKTFFKVFPYLFFLFFSISSLAAEEKLNGEKLYRQHCFDCHGEKGQSSKENIPIISGFSAINIFDSLYEFKDGDREALSIKQKDGKSLDMKEVSKRLDEEQTEALALYLSQQEFKPARQEESNEPLLEEGKQIHEDLCNDCHGDYGKSVLDDAPILSGQWKAYLKRQFKQFSESKRYIPRKMKRKFRKLSDRDKKALLDFYAHTPKK